MEPTKQHPLQPQWDWLCRLPVGTWVVRGDGSIWLKADMRNVLHHRDGNCYFFSTETGEAIHFSHLASETLPPRQYTRPSPFKV